MLRLCSWELSLGLRGCGGDVREGANGEGVVRPPRTCSLSEAQATLPPTAPTSWRHCRPRGKMASPRHEVRW